MTTAAPAIELRGLRVRIDTTEILRGVDLVLERGSTLGVVGQSGSGKSMTARALAGLLPPGATTSGEYLLAGRPVELAGRESSWRRLRGAHVVWLPQDPFTSLDPLRRCGEQVLAGLSAPSSRARQVRLTEAERRLREVGLPPGVARAYPHQLSGGMRQRVAIAAALAPDPEVLIADEPTTALDVTTQAGILDLLDRLRRERGLSMVLITHDLLLARERCDHLAVFHDGRAVESGPTERIVTAAEHAVTRELVAAGLAGPIHRGDDRDTPGVLVARGISKTYPGADRPALIGADLEVAAGEIVGVVGESGSGKTTLSRCLVGLERPDHGQFGYLDPDGRPQPWSPSQAQLVFQNPYASLNPSMSVRSTLVEALRSSGRSAGELPGLLELVGLDPALAGRRPARLSGGERQRVAIARALAPRPRVLFCDEAVSALDAPIQARILRMLAELRDRLGLAIVFVTHDLGVVRQLAQRIYVMRAGRIVETGLTEQVLDHPRHDYTRELLASLPGVRPAPDLEPHRQEAAHVRGA